MPQKLKAVGVRFAPETLDALAADARDGGSVGATVRRIVEAHYATGGRPELMGATEAAWTLGTTTSNLPKFELPEPVYGPDHPDPRFRLIKGRLWDAGEIRALAERLGRTARFTS